MIKKIKETLSQMFFSPEATGTWENIDKVECSIDEDVVECSEMNDSTSYTGVPAPAYLEYDEWFGSEEPVKSEKQKEYMETEIEMKRQEREENFSVEPDNIHELMYQIATQNQSTTLHLDPPGGSENFQEGWQSGTGWGQYQ
tara:strand:+ start:166 stop:591 length:426 start_codon:yes stop_codon:yes gene_type:complete